MSPERGISRRQWLRLAGRVSLAGGLATLAPWPRPVWGDVSMKQSTQLPVVELAGGPEEVGRGWGRALAEPMRQGLDRILAVVHEVHKTSRQDALAKAMVLWPAAVQFEPEVEPFVRGQAQGAEMSLEEAWATRCGLELLFMNTNLAAGCTTLAGTGPATPDGKVIMGPEHRLVHGHAPGPAAHPSLRRPAPVGAAHSGPGRIHHELRRPGLLPQRRGAHAAGVEAPGGPGGLSAPGHAPERPGPGAGGAQAGQPGHRGRNPWPTPRTACAAWRALWMTTRCSSPRRASWCTPTTTARRASRRLTAFP